MVLPSTSSARRTPVFPPRRVGALRRLRRVDAQRLRGLGFLPVAVGARIGFGRQHRGRRGSYRHRPEPLVEYRTAPASSNVTSMTKRLDLMRFLINKHCDLYAAHLADAILGVEAISMSRLAMWESLMRGDTTVSQAFMTHPTYGDGGMAAAVRLRS